MVDPKRTFSASLNAKTALLFSTPTKRCVSSESYIKSIVICKKIKNVIKIIVYKINEIIIIKTNKNFGKN